MQKQATVVSQPSLLKSQSTTLSQQQGGLLSATPKFMFGHKGDVRNNLHFLDNTTVCYPVGHNVVFYSIDDKSQNFLPGIEGSEGITALALSANRKQLAVCEKSAKAICSVYNVGKMLETFKDSQSKKLGSSTYDQATIRKRKVLISNDSTARAFISADFSATNDKLLVTLGDDLSIIVWQFDKMKCLALETLQLHKDSIPR